MMTMRRRKNIKNTLKIWIRLKLGHCRRDYFRRVVVWWLYSNFKKGHSNLGTPYCQHGTCNLNRLRNGCAMVEKPGTIVLIMIMAFEVGPFSSCCCMKFLTSNDFGGRISSKPASLTVGYSRTRTRIYKSTAYRRERASGKMLGSLQVYKYPLRPQVRRAKMSNVYLLVVFRWVDIILK